MIPRDRMESLALSSAEVDPPGDDGASMVRLHTSGGVIRCRLHEATAAGPTAVLWVFGAGGGLGGPAGGIYARLGAGLARGGIASLELDYRRPGDLAGCVGDVRVALEFLAGRGRSRVVLVGHSFGGAVVITAGATSDAVIAVAALSSQTRGTDAAAALSPRPLFVAHGTADEVLPDRCSRDIYARAREPKELKLYPGGRHGLDQCRAELDRDLGGWISRVVG